MLRTMASDIHIPVLEFDLGLHLVYANDAGLALLGLDQSLVEAGIHIDQLISDEYRTLVHTGLQRLESDTTPTSVSLRVVRQDGIEVPAEAFAAPTYRGSTLCGFVAYLLDMSRRAIVDQKLLDEEEVLQQAVEHSLAGIFVVGADYTVEYANDRLCEMAGRTRSEILHHDFREYLHPESVALVQDMYLKRQRGERVPSVYEFKVVRKDGQVLDVVISSVVAKTRDGSVKTVAQITDITEELRSKQALKVSEHRYRSLVETMIDGLAVDDENGKIVYANDALARMMGYASGPEVVGLRDSDILDGFTPEVMHEKMEARRERKTERYEAALKHRSGRAIPVIVRSSPMLGMDGEHIGSFALFSDVSELRRAEAQSQFLLDLLLHDIGNQLQLIVGGIDLYTPDSPTDTVDSALQYIRSGAERCLELINKTRRAEESRTEPLQPADLIQALKIEVDLIERLYHVKASLDVVPEHVMVNVDGALSQLIWNLLENAVRHNPRGDRMIWVRGRESGDLFELSIADNGPGLTDSEKEQTIKSGRRFGGVGLHIVRTLVAKYDGSLRVEDRVMEDRSQGLRVIVTFKIAQPPSD